jgi:8-oxo-dGTP diphosphatase
MVKEIHVVGAVIVRDGLVLCARRGPQQSLPGMWEFPGGKVEPGESSSEALAREITEELGCNILVGEQINTHAHDYPFARVVLSTFWCRISAGEPVTGEHAELRWVDPADVYDLDWAPADIPAVSLLARSV